MNCREYKKIHDQVEEAYRVIKRERDRAWRAANPEKSRASAQKWREANRHEHRISNRLWRFFNPDKSQQSTRAWRERNPDYHKQWRERMKAQGHFKKGGKYYYPRKPKGEHA
jgi:hypothetical protein